MKKKVKYENEIDLGEIILILWLNKWKIVLIPFLFMSLTYVFEINKSPFKSLYSSKTEIRPISIFDENEYDLFNAFLKKFDDPEGDIEKRVQFSSFAYINRNT